MAKPLSEMSREELWALFPIVLEEYNPDWPDWYREEEKQLTHSLDAACRVRIQHIGSTAVPGLMAKPIIDILLEITEGCELKLLVEALQQQGYILERQPDKPAPQMMFMKGYTERGFAERVFHLHVRYKGDWDELYFRDYLREHEAVADAYAQLKCGLRNKYQHDRDRYTDAKRDFVQKYTQIARESRKK